MDQNSVMNRIVVLMAFAIALFVFIYRFFISESDMFTATIYAVLVMMVSIMVFQFTFQSIAKVLMKHLDDAHKTSEETSFEEETDDENNIAADPLQKQTEESVDNRQKRG